VTSTGVGDRRTTPVDDSGRATRPRSLPGRSLRFPSPDSEFVLDLLEPGKDRGLIFPTDCVEELPQDLATGRDGRGVRSRQVLAQGSPVPDEVEVVRLAFDEGDQAREGAARLGVLIGVFVR